MQHNTPPTLKRCKCKWLVFDGWVRPHIPNHGNDMQGNDQCHVLAHLTLKGEPLVPTGLAAGWPSGQAQTWWQRK